MKRRTFLAAAIGSAFAPAAAFKPWALPVLYGDGIHDDTAALQAAMDGKRVHWADGAGIVGTIMVGRKFLLSDTLHLGGPNRPHCVFKECDFSFPNKPYEKPALRIQRMA